MKFIVFGVTLLALFTLFSFRVVDEIIQDIKHSKEDEDEQDI